MYKKIQIIAEVKTQSPFGFRSDHSFADLFAIAKEVGDIISIHTDPRWGGSFESVRMVRSSTSKPILAKGIHATDDEIKQAIDSGADYVLVVGRVPKIYLEKCIIEPLNLEELKNISINSKVVWNSRDLSNGQLKLETFKDARQIFKGWLCQASNIRNVHDIEDGANAVLVGTNLIEFAKSLQ